MFLFSNNRTVDQFQNQPVTHRMSKMIVVSNERDTGGNERDTKIDWW